ncbi:MULTISPECIES: hypothetical protein [unclassified Streptomyces]|uniref:hypothetical protein n=1 Tax=unclassified Streptomyces TaxID=2593676 RepID=UPI000CD5A904|nr:MULTISPECIES: hypothetical protein [unclassified Streptomyces]
MRAYIGRHEVLDHTDFIELSLGTDPELWLGVEGESAEERAARLDAGLDILKDDPELAPAVALITADAITRRPGLLAGVLPATGGAR